MKIGIVYNSSKGKKDVELCLRLCAELNRLSFQTYTVDLGAKKPLHESYYEAKNPCPDFLISIGGAGFEWRIGEKGFSYSVIPCRQAHLFPDPKFPLENEAVDYPVNFSHFFIFAGQETVSYVREKFPNIENTACLPELDTADDASAILQAVFDITELSVDFKECRLSER